MKKQKCILKYTLLLVIFFHTNFYSQVEMISNWEVFNQSNSKLPSDNIYQVLISQNNEKYIQTDLGWGILSADNWQWIYRGNNSDNLKITFQKNGNVWAVIENKLFELKNANLKLKKSFNDENGNIIYLSNIKALNNGNICIGTYNSSFIIYDGKKFSETKLPAKSYPEEIRGIVEDNRGNIWVIGYHGSSAGNWGALYKYDGKIIKRYNSDNCNISTDAFSSIYCDNNDLWLGSWGYLFKFDGTSWDMFGESNEFFVNAEISCITVDKDKNVWFTAGGNTSGVGKFNSKVLKYYTPANSQLTTRHIGNLDLDSDKNLWLAGGEYLFFIK